MLGSHSHLLPAMTHFPYNGLGFGFDPRSILLSPSGWWRRKAQVMHEASNGLSRKWRARQSLGG